MSHVPPRGPLYRIPTLPASKRMSTMLPSINEQKSQMPRTRISILFRPPVIFATNSSHQRRRGRHGSFQAMCSPSSTFYWFFPSPLCPDTDRSNLIADGGCTHMRWSLFCLSTAYAAARPTSRQASPFGLRLSWALILPLTSLPFPLASPSLG